MNDHRLCVARPKQVRFFLPSEWFPQMALMNSCGGGVDQGSDGRTSDRIPSQSCCFWWVDDRSSNKNKASNHTSAHFYYYMRWVRLLSWTDEPWMLIHISGIYTKAMPPSPPTRRFPPPPSPCWILNEVSALWTGVFSNSEGVHNKSITNRDRQTITCAPELDLYQKPFTYIRIYLCSTSLYYIFVCSCFVLNFGLKFYTW